MLRSAKMKYQSNIEWWIWSYPFICSNETMNQTDEGGWDSSRITENCNEVGKFRTECNRVPDQLWWTAVRSFEGSSTFTSKLHQTYLLEYLTSDFYRIALGFYPEKHSTRKMQLSNFVINLPIIIILAHFKPVPSYINNSVCIFLCVWFRSIFKC
jgi:hypothetical protein